MTRKDIQDYMDVRISSRVHDEETIEVDPNDMLCKHCKRRRSNHAGEQCLFDSSRYEAMTFDEMKEAVLGFMMNQEF